MDSQPLQYRLEAFEGPLDLLLTLISKNKIDIYDIPIAELIEQYLEQIKVMQENQLDIESEFLTMASRLVYIKSVMLLLSMKKKLKNLRRTHGTAYRICNLPSDSQEIQRDLRLRQLLQEASPVEYDLTYNRIHPSEDIAKAYVSAVGRGKRKLPPPESAFSVIVARKFVSVSSRIIHVMRKLWKGRRIEYQELLTPAKKRANL